MSPPTIDCSRRVCLTPARSAAVVCRALREALGQRVRLGGLRRFTTGFNSNSRVYESRRTQPRHARDVAMMSAKIQPPFGWPFLRSWWRAEPAVRAIPVAGAIAARVRIVSAPSYRRRRRLNGRRRRRGSLEMPSPGTGPRRTRRQRRSRSGGSGSNWWEITPGARRAADV